MERRSMGKNVESREARKRKLELRESEFSLSTSSFHQLKTPRAVTPSENSTACGDDVNADRVFSSRCLSNASKISKLEDESEASSASSTGDSMDFSDRSIKTRKSKEAVKMPSEAELDEFFEAAEKDLLKNFILKYNYDIVKDQPLEGSYEWIQNSTEDKNKKR